MLTLKRDKNGKITVFGENGGTKEVVQSPVSKENFIITEEDNNKTSTEVEQKRITKTTFTKPQINQILISIISNDSKQCGCNCKPEKMLSSFYKPDEYDKFILRLCTKFNLDVMTVKNEINNQHWQTFTIQSVLNIIVRLCNVIS